MYYQYIKTKDAAPTVCLIHGFLGTQNDWNAVTTALQHDVNLLLIDIPGHGQSDGDASLGFSMIAYRLSQILKHEHIDRIVLVGYSLGGRIARHFAHHYPIYIRHLILISTHLGLSTPQERLNRAYADDQTCQRLMAIPWHQFLSEWYDAPLFNRLKLSGHYDRIVADRCLQSPHLLSLVLLKLSLSNQPLYTSLRTPFPIDYLCGRHDAKFYQLSQQYASFLSVHSHPDADHAVHLTHPEWISSFLDQILIPLQV